MINPVKYATKKMVESKGNGYLLGEYTIMIEEIQKDAYNQALEDASKNAITSKRIHEAEIDDDEWDENSLWCNKYEILKLKMK